jgi:nucleoside-diphosphate-sugar epimerase
MSVLVTGASGLVGSHVVEALAARGEPVRALVRPASGAVVARLGAEPVVGDVTDPAAWQAAARGVRAIVHAAALVQQPASWERYLAVNVDATRLAVAAARAAGARLVYISSVAVYGGSAAYPATPERREEDDAFQPIATPDFYARTKRMAEDAVREAATRREVDAAALRPTVIYGERDRQFTPRVMRAMRLWFVPQIGPGTNRLSCVYAGNVAAATVAALDAPRLGGEGEGGFRAYNVTSDGPPALSQREFFAAFAAALGRRYRPMPIPAPLAGLAIGLFTARRLARAAVAFLSGENPYSDERIRRELGWRPPTPAPEAIRRTVAWFLENEKPGR